MELTITKPLRKSLTVRLERLWLDELKGDHLHPFCLSLMLNSKPIRAPEKSAYKESLEVGIGCSSGTLLIFEIKPTP
jgi:hypothetical protein